MSFIAAILLLNMEVADAFVFFANVLNRPCQVAFFRMDENIVSTLFLICCLESKVFFFLLKMFFNVSCPICVNLCV